VRDGESYGCPSLPLKLLVLDSVWTGRQVSPSIGSDNFVCPYVEKVIVVQYQSASNMVVIFIYSDPKRQ
jgi:hypothetical protein